MAGKDEKFIKFYTTSILQSYDYQKMTLEEKGLYSHLLYLLAETTDGELIYDEKLLAHQCGIVPQVFRRVFGKIKYKFEFDTRENSAQTPDKLGSNSAQTPDKLKTYFYNPKMKLIVLARQEKSKKCSDSGTLGGKTTQSKNEANALANAQANASAREEREKERERDKNIKTLKTDESLSAAAAEKANAKNTNLPSCPYQKIVDLYHEMMPNNPRVRGLDETRRSYLRQIWFSKEKWRDLEHWRRFFAYCNESPLLSCRVQREGHNSRIFDLEWLTKPKNFLKISEGKYHDNHGGGQ